MAMNLATKGIKRLEKISTKKRTQAVTEGAKRAVILRAGAEIKQQIKNMDRQAPLDADTVAAKGHSRLFEDGSTRGLQLKKSFEGRPKKMRSGVWGYFIRNKGNRTTVSKRTLNTNRLTKRTTKSGRSYFGIRTRHETGARRTDTQVRFTVRKKGGHSRTITNGKIAGILREGDGRFLPARPYHVLPAAIRARLTKESINQTIRRDMRRITRGGLVAIREVADITRQIVTGI